MADTFLNELRFAFLKTKKTSENIRIALHKYFAAFYNNDYLLINEILKKETLDNPFSQKTLDKMNFQHLNVTKKIIKRLTSGIYTKEPVRELITKEATEKTPAKTDDNLKPLLSQIRYSQKVKDAYRKAKYFNCIAVGVMWDKQLNKMRLDVVTPDSFEVETKNDYLVMDRIKIEKANAEGEIYYTVWSDTEHYIIEGEKKLAPYSDNEDSINPYGKIPYVILRMEEGCDFYGEPNWNLLLNQKNLDIRLTDLNEAELRDINKIWHGINTKFKEGQRFSAGELLQSYSTDQEQISLEAISSDTNYTSIRENIDWKTKTVMNSEGLSAQSGSVDATDESGVKRMIDEIELQESRDDDVEILYNFEIELLEMVRIVNNAYSKLKLSKDGIFEVMFQENKPTESIDNKVLRREMESAIGYKDEIDFTMEDMQVDEKTAIAILQARKDRMKSLGLDDRKDDAEDTNNEDTGKENNDLTKD